ncbi:MAG: signal peptidase I [Candidatus Omnitrophica bacterium]|nr:signal peptidase I [Candidatus Omnitrophota bacterium]
MRADYGAVAIDIVRESLTCGDTVRLCVETGSMTPFICAGDAVSVRQVSPAQLKRGDVLVYSSGKRIFVHRLLSRHNRQLIVKGDRCRLCDGPVPSAQVLGKVVAVTKPYVRLNLEHGLWVALGLCAAWCSYVESRLYRFLRPERAAIPDGSG